MQEYKCRTKPVDASEVHCKADFHAKRENGRQFEKKKKCGSIFPSIAYQVSEVWGGKGAPPTLLNKRIDGKVPNAA